jgi:hypothetical protein
MTMKKMWVWMLLALLTLVGEWCGRCDGCLREERIGLLGIKSSIDPDGFSLRYWVDSKEDISDCCEWGRIKCDNTTRRVIELNLWGVRGANLRGWVLNASLFLPFKELQSLDLSLNGIAFCYENQGWFNVYVVIIISLSEYYTEITLIKWLVFSVNYFTLRFLLHAGFEVLSSKLRKLNVNDLSDNKFNDDSILPCLTGLSSLNSLDLSDNMLTGSGNI